MTNVIFRTKQSDWYEASLCKRELAFFHQRNKNGKGLFDEAIRKNENIIRSFLAA